ncbi:hypothetical protein [uncultured Selenomonas sp.]|uniref:hypothetical protein n=1 Tax=uncultured Selenomonas sp. TaxID=159275 RepID=UPI0028EE76C0|nr:hypothetical protein [uncultured Selenomonas sp.]
MEYLIVIAVAITLAVFDDRVRGRKKVPPPTVPQDIPRPKKRTAQTGSFEIPPLRGAPRDVQITVDAEVLRAQELRARWEEQQREALRAKRAREREERLAAEQMAAAAAVPHTGGHAHAHAALLPQLTPDTMKQAIVLAEVLGKPRALRRFPRR